MSSEKSRLGRDGVILRRLGGPWGLAGHGRISSRTRRMTPSGAALACTSPFLVGGLAVTVKSSPHVGSRWGREWDSRPGPRPSTRSCGRRLPSDHLDGITALLQACHLQTGQRATTEDGEDAQRPKVAAPGGWRDGTYKGGEHRAPLMAVLPCSPPPIPSTFFLPPSLPRPASTCPT